jgi:hypothetical protein
MIFQRLFVKLSHGWEGKRCPTLDPPPYGAPGTFPVTHRFSTIPTLSRALVDTNVLLGAALIEDGIARRAVRSVQSLGHAVYCDEISYGEAVRRLERARRHLGLPYDPVVVFEHLVYRLGILFVPPGDPIIPTSIHRHDRHIPRAAGQFATWVMTDDIELQIALTAAGFEARNSFEVLQAAAENGSSPATAPPLPARIGPAAPKAAKGWVMAWVTPGPWASGHPSGHRTVVDLPGFGHVYYDTDTAAWKAEVPFASQTLSAPFPLQPDIPVAVGIGFDGSRVPGKLFVASGAPSSPPNYVSANTQAHVPYCTIADAAIGHTLANDSHWNGQVRRLSAGDRFVSKKLWKHLVSVEDIAPHPELDVLDKTLVVIGNLSEWGQVAARRAEL